MAKPLQLFVKPPYGTWTLVNGYGRNPAVPARFNSSVLLETTGSAAFVAAATGKLWRDGLTTASSRRTSP